ncbi:flagellar hook-length control protein FliK [Motilimonas sp. E26]|uniref:flagellar hook-length control protein FliK n=1 Tax=Motilimonas sp. E26 TaxID=2865674 RepID=UPI001E50EAEC|nr:flagellar hook-length control protein FliK [Motilimonas sp. E26]MCE0556241.1 flagellar hook-length control protein FliK [Motilimonas sp. E26]
MMQSVQSQLNNVSVSQPNDSAAFMDQEADRHIEFKQTYEAAKAKKAEQHADIENEQQAIRAKQDQDIQAEKEFADKQKIEDGQKKANESLTATTDGSEKQSVASDIGQDILAQIKQAEQQTPKALRADSTDSAVKPVTALNSISQALKQALQQESNEQSEEDSASTYESLNDAPSLANLSADSSISNAEASPHSNAEASPQFEQGKIKSTDSIESLLNKLTSKLDDDVVVTDPHSALNQSEIKIAKQAAQETGPLVSEEGVNPETEEAKALQQFDTQAAKEAVNVVTEAKEQYVQLSQQRVTAEQKESSEGVKPMAQEADALVSKNIPKADTSEPNQQQDTRVVSPALNNQEPKADDTVRRSDSHQVQGAETKATLLAESEGYQGANSQLKPLNTQTTNIAETDAVVTDVGKEADKSVAVVNAGLVSSKEKGTNVTTDAKGNIVANAPVINTESDVMAKRTEFKPSEFVNTLDASMSDSQEKPASLGEKVEPNTAKLQAKEQVSQLAQQERLLKENQAIESFKSNFKEVNTDRYNAPQPMNFVQPAGQSTAPVSQTFQGLHHHQQQLTAAQSLNSQATANINAQQAQTTSQFELGQKFELASREAPTIMRERITMMMNKGIGQAEIRLDPAELGSMHVKLSMQNDQLSVSIQTTQPQSKELLDQHMPRLREMLTQQGINLGESHVSQQQSGSQQGGDSAQGSGSGQASTAQQSNIVEDSPTQTVRNYVQSNSAIDFYA